MHRFPAPTRVYGLRPLLTRSGAGTIAATLLVVASWYSAFESDQEPCGSLRIVTDRAGDRVAKVTKEGEVQCV